MHDIDKLCMGCMSDNGGEQICRICGYDSETPNTPQAIPQKTLLEGRYVVGKVLESGGDGITYVGLDTVTDDVVRIREFFPAGLCNREDDGFVTFNNGSEFGSGQGLNLFLELANNLLSLNGTPGLLNVLDVFEHNGTAYYVTESPSGITLREFLLRNGGQLIWEQAKALFLPLLSTLTTLHEAKIVHRGISPETLIVGRDGKLYLTGFCTAAARTARSEMAARLFPGFAAIEQYGFDGQQGPWTDVYGVAATLFRTLVGNPPPEATERVTNDNMTIPAKLVEEIPKGALVALANALQILPEDRTKSVAELRTAISKQSSVSPLVTPKRKSTVNKADEDADKKKYAIIAAIVTAVILTVIGILVFILQWDAWFSTGGTSSGHSSVVAPSDSLVSTNNNIDNPKMPNIVKLTYPEAVKALDQNGAVDYKIIIEKVYNDEYDDGVIFEQNPAPNTDVTKNMEISVKMSMGKETVKIPDFASMKSTYPEAYLALLELGFSPRNIVPVELSMLGADANVVFETSPAAGTEVSRESMIQVSYYVPQAEVQCPNFVGKNYETEVKNTAFNTQVEYAYSNSYAEGQVINQSIGAGTMIKNTDLIVLTVSKGKKPVVPKVQGLLKDDAIAKLREARIDRYEIREVYDDNVENGCVATVTPGAGTNVGSDETVTLYVSLGPEPNDGVEDLPESSVPAVNNDTSSKEENDSSKEEQSSKPSDNASKKED